MIWTATSNLEELRVVQRSCHSPSSSSTILSTTCAITPPRFAKTLYNREYCVTDTVNLFIPIGRHVKLLATHDMTGSIILAACMLAICLPILAVQLPRTALCARLRSKYYAETRSPRPASATHQTSQTHSDSQSLRWRARCAAKTDGYTSSEDSQISTPVVRSPVAFNIPISSRMQQEQREERQARKPWNPPFPSRKGTELARKWEEMPPLPPKKTGREMEEKGVARRLFPPDVDGDSSQQDQDEYVPVHATKENEPLRLPLHKPESPPQPARRTANSGLKSLVWPAVAILAVLLFIFAFALLIAHCLAWFLVYKTEARLGEARRGIVQGGEMRLCLCAT